MDRPTWIYLYNCGHELTVHMDPSTHTPAKPGDFAQCYGCEGYREVVTVHWAASVSEVVEELRTIAASCRV